MRGTTVLAVLASTVLAAKMLAAAHAPGPAQRRTLAVLERSSALEADAEPSSAEPPTHEDAATACRATAAAAARARTTPAERQRAFDVTFCSCMGGMPVVVASVDWRSAGVGCAQPFGL